MSGAQTQGGATPQASGDLAPMQMLQSYKSAPDRAAWLAENQTQAQPVQPWQPPQRMYAHQAAPAQEDAYEPWRPKTMREAALGTIQRSIQAQMNPRRQTSGLLNGGTGSSQNGQGAK